MLKFPTLFILIFYAGLRGLGSNNFRNSSYKEKTAGSARVSRLSFRFLWLCIYILHQFSWGHNLTQKVSSNMQPSKGVLKASSTRLQRNNFLYSKTSWRRLEDILQDVLKTSSKKRNCYAEDVLRHVLKTSLETNKMFTVDICI